jgi:hypothetical protein
MKDSASKLRSLCIEKKWFTCGSNTEYEKLLNLADSGVSLEETARIIFLNSDDYNYNVILETLKESFDE